MAFTREDELERGDPKVCDSVWQNKNEYNHKSQ